MPREGHHTTDRLIGSQENAYGRSVGHAQL